MKRITFVVGAVILVMAVILAACQSAQPVQVPQPVHVVVDNAAEFTGIGGAEGGGEQGLVGAPTNIRSLVAGEIYDKGTLAVDGASTLTGAVSAGSTLAVTGASTLTGAVTTVAGLTVGTSISHGAQSAVTVTNGGTIAVTDDIVPLTAGGNVGTSTITGCSTANKITVLRNTANVTITITDTSTIMLEGNAALGQYDTLVLLGDGTNCLQLAKGNN